MVTLFPKDKSAGNVRSRNLILSKMKSYLEPSECSMLEVGCANGRYGELLGPFVSKYSGIDVVPQYIKIANEENELENVCYHLCESESIPLEGKFDIVLYAFSFHVIPNLGKTLEEARRVLKDDGKVFILDPSLHNERWASPRLNKDSPEFDPESLRSKREQLEQATEFLDTQNKFRIVERDVNDFRSFYVLK
jgi:ubiquinone/menaquinone biosynthesis C-methylase UbiE